MQQPHKFAMTKLLLNCLCVLLLNACANSTGNTQLYGTLSGGIETVHTRH